MARADIRSNTCEAESSGPKSMSEASASRRSQGRSPTPSCSDSLASHQLCTYESSLAPPSGADEGPSATGAGGRSGATGATVDHSPVGGSTAARESSTTGVEGENGASDPSDGQTTVCTSDGAGEGAGNTSSTYNQEDVPAAPAGALGTALGSESQEENGPRLGSTGIAQLASEASGTS